MNEIDAKFPPTIFYTKQKDSNVKNDFYFTIETNCSIRKDIPSEQKTPKIYIKGLEQLFSSESAMEAFAKSFQASSNVDDWIITYGCFRDTQELCLVATYCLDPEASSIPENIFPVAFRSVQEKFQFTADFSKFSDKNPIGIQVYFDDFDFLSSELKDKIGPQKYSINVNEIAYILDFYAKYTKDAKDPQAPKVQAIHKGEEAEIGWDLGDVHKVSASLCDENGCQVANLPFTYNVKIDRDRKFTLSVEKDGHVETKSLPIYRTLWEKVAEVDSSSLPEGFKPDPKGNNKFFRRSDGYYIYIHPYIWYSRDLIEWKKITEYKDAPKDFNSYCSNYADSYEELTITYACDNGVFLSEYHFRADDKHKWTDKIIITNQESLFCQSVKKNNITISFTVDENIIDIYTINNGHWENKKTFLIPESSNILSIDALSLPNDEIILAILCNNKRVYTYNYKIQSDSINDVILYENTNENNIYEFAKDNQKKNISFMQSFSLYNSR